MEMETEGKIARIRKDKKALDLGFDCWYQSNFKPLEVNVGDQVKIVFNEVKKGNTLFRNIKSIKVLDPDWSKQIDSNYEDHPAKERLSEKFDTIMNEKELTPTDRNCILLTAKDCYIEDRKHDCRPLVWWITEIKRLRLGI